MKTHLGHLTFCTNIFPGETWEAHFKALKENIPLIKKRIAPDDSFGIGLRLSDLASRQLLERDALPFFKKWLKEQNCYVFAINGFPFGNFHKRPVKDKVHLPDWTTNDRLQYTLRLFNLIDDLLPEGMEGGVSTSPLSYKHWFTAREAVKAVKKATLNIVEVVCALFEINKQNGKVLHLDLEPEADGLIESSEEFVRWFIESLIPIGIPILKQRFSLVEQEAEKIMKDHVRLCFDVCHFAVGFEDVSTVVKRLKKADIKIGRWQLSAALKLNLSEDEKEKEESLRALKKFDEPVYLHQVVAQKEDGRLLRYPDLPEALIDKEAKQSGEWRSHFHVPLFTDRYGLLQSTQQGVKEALHLQKQETLCQILEVETYTWDVLPKDLKLPIAESIVRELEWIVEII